MCSRYEEDGNLVFPNDTVYIFIEYQGKIVKIPSSWGFKNNGHIVFNARCETINDIPLFKGLKHCIVKADYYFEYDSNKHKIIFQSHNKQPLLIAGLVRKNGKNEHTIITTSPNESIKPIHDRMPLIVNKEEATKWLFHQDSEKILKSTPDELDVYRKIEQMELDI